MGQIVSIKKASEEKVTKQLNKDKLKALKGNKRTLLKLWLKYSKMKDRTEEQDEFKKYLYHRLCG
jgi:hypothetical protein